MVFVHQVDVAGSCADPDREWESYSVVHETVQHSAGEHSAKSASFKDQGCIFDSDHMAKVVIQKHKTAWFRAFDVQSAYFVLCKFSNFDS